MSGRPPSLALYGAVTALLAPLAPALLQARARRGKEDAARLGERMGRPSRPRPEGPLVWIHAVSVGESLSVLPLVHWFNHERPDLAVLVTTGTRTAAELLGRRLPGAAVHQYAPIDTPGAVARFLDHWRPDLGLFAESELWPNLILTAKRRGVRLALVSARITGRTARRWARWPAAARSVLGAFDLVLAQDDASAQRLARLGVTSAGSLNLKLFAEALPFDEAALLALRAQIGGRPVVLAASTHAPEETMIAEALRRLEAAPPPLLILAPRHPDRGEAVATALAGDGRRVARRRAGEPIGPDTEVYVADTLGELGLFFRLADAVVMGGSFGAGVGGHNPLEPARLSAPIISGADVANFADAYAGLWAAGGALKAEGMADLGAHLGTLVADAGKRRAIGEAAFEYAQARRGDLDRAMERLAPLAPPRAA